MNEKYPQDGQISGDQFFPSFSDAHPVRELGLELGDLKVDLVQVLVHKSHQALLHHLIKSENNCKSFPARHQTKQNKITEILLLPLFCTHLQKERASCMIRQFKTIISINLF